MLLNIVTGVSGEIMQQNSTNVDQAIDIGVKQL